MGRVRVPIFDENDVPTPQGEGILFAFGECIQDDDSLWVYLRVREPKKTGAGTDYRDITWSFASKEQTPRIWYQPKTTFWREHALDEGALLARLFAPPEGRDSANTRIIFKIEDVYGEQDDRDPAKVWWKIDTDEKCHVYVHKPLNKDMSDEQKALWRERYGNEEWIHLYTLEAKNLAKSKQPQPEPVGVVGVVGRNDDEEIADI